MAKPIVSDELWEIVEPLIPRVERRFRNPGRKRIDDRRVLTGILFVLKTGIPWEHLPQEMGCGSGMTCWRRLRDWNEAGVWERLHQVLLKETIRPSCHPMTCANGSATSAPLFRPRPRRLWND